MLVWWREAKMPQLQRKALRSRICSCAMLASWATREADLLEDREGILVSTFALVASCSIGGCLSLSSGGVASACDGIMDGGQVARPAISCHPDSVWSAGDSYVNSFARAERLNTGIALIRSCYIPSFDLASFDGSIPLR